MTQPVGKTVTDLIERCEGWIKSLDFYATTYDSSPEMVVAVAVEMRAELAIACRLIAIPQESADDKARTALLKLVEIHHGTLTPSKLHDPHNRDWTECECKSCRLAQPFAKGAE